MPAEAVAHIHLDPVGGIAGDMFAAALLDAFPQLEEGLCAALRRLDPPASLVARSEAGRNGGFSGRRWRVEVEGPAVPTGAFPALVARLSASALAGPVRDRAIAILTILAEAEARVHGVATSEVHFHELADWDSLLDVVAAAWLIESIACPSWSVGPIPLGRGRVMSAHGPLPVPAPATALLLEGFPVIDDGIDGERVTPTGAAILKHLRPRTRGMDGPLRIARSGIGLGARTMPGIANMLRALVLAPVEGASEDQVGLLRFEIDDQTGEDLAIGLERLRQMVDVLDVCHWPAIGKHGRMMAAIQVICRSDAVSAVADACASETSTIGLRWRIEQRRILPREAVTGDGIATKRVQRPDGSRTAKAESADLAGQGGYAERRRLARAAEALAEEQS